MAQFGDRECSMTSGLWRIWRSSAKRGGFRANVICICPHDSANIQTKVWLANQPTKYTYQSPSWEANTSSVSQDILHIYAPGGPSPRFQEPATWP